MSKGPLALPLRVAVAAGLTALVVWQSDVSAIVAATRGARLDYLLLACALVILDRVLMAYRWLTLLSPLAPGVRPRAAVIMRVFFVSTFVGTFLPASVGSDLARVFGLSKHGVGAAEAIASVLVDRLLGVVSILLVAFAGAILARELVDIQVLLPALAGLSAACAAGLAVVFSPRVAGVIARLLDRLARRRDAGQRLVSSIQRYSSYRANLANVLGCSIGVQVLRVLQTYCLGLALGLTVPLDVYFALVPIILLIVLMPITINGIGTTQAGFVWLFARAGVGSAPAFALSVLFLAIGLVGNLPGGVLYALGGSREQRSG